MSRFWLGIGLLVLFLAMGLWISFSVDSIHQTIAETLDQAAAQTLSGDPEAGLALARQARSDWETRWRETASIADHAPMDEIDGLFAQLEIYGQTDNHADFAAYCSRLAKLVTAVGEAHTLNWWNLL